LKLLLQDKQMQSRRQILLSVGAACVAGCAQRGQFAIATQTQGAAGLQPLLVATTRQADPAPIAYGAQRAQALDFALLTVSIPQGHKTGEIEWPAGGDPDPAQHFALVGAETLPDLDRFSTRVKQQAASAGEPETVLFVHGYNMTFAEGVYRHAQIAWDYGMKGPQVHFAWPSAADPLGYTYDRDSALASRDALVTLLMRLLDDGRRVALVGHSMGGFLVMEALRQIALQGDREVLNKLAHVTLISPDIDIDLFLAQTRAIETLPQPFAIAVTRNDRMLRLATRISGGQPRLGLINDLDRLGGLGVLVIDMSQISANGSNHFLAGSSPTAIALIKGLQNSQVRGAQNFALGPVRITLGGGGASGG
jgi:esterase/lipase superfamily enzyme